uniref:Uncharacterized protein n=1 Tax=Cacopsylla melanoneura TaxID=428564 RepID=A0A8D8S8K4_9HEMI
MNFIPSVKIHLIRFCLNVPSTSFPEQIFRRLFQAVVCIFIILGRDFEALRYFTVLFTRSLLSLYENPKSSILRGGGNKLYFSFLLQQLSLSKSLPPSLPPSLPASLRIIENQI